MRRKDRRKTFLFFVKSILMEYLSISSRPVDPGMSKIFRKKTEDMLENHLALGALRIYWSLLEFQNYFSHPH